jgi:DNA-binding NtrC family response regulator
MTDITKLVVLYVEDEPELRDHVGYALRLYIDTVLTASNGQEALELIRRTKPDILISDIRMPQMDGLELTVRIRRQLPGIPVLLCTAFTDTDYLLKAIELGVAAYIPKPIDTERLIAAITRAALPILQNREIQRLRSRAVHDCLILKSNNPAMQLLGEQISQVADSSYAVVIKGESGTGKSTVAELLHTMSNRNARHCLTVDCRSRSAEQLEAELFGKSSGRGRPATQRDTGVLGDISGGTLVLDAPELLPLPLQERLLNLLEKRAYLPTGGTDTIHCDLRVLTLTTLDLAKEALEGRFNNNLWLRLSDVLLEIPPLRERSVDIPAFCCSLLALAADDLGCRCPVLSPEAVRLLQKETWPGNFRQLKQCLRQAVFRTDGLITPADLKPLLTAPVVTTAISLETLPSFSLSALEEWGMQRALQASNGKKMLAAELLGISYNAFKEKLKKYGMQEPAS